MIVYEIAPNTTAVCTVGVLYCTWYAQYRSALYSRARTMILHVEDQGF